MGKIFLYSLLALLALNFAIKAVWYFKYSKATGIVTEHRAFSSVSHSNGGDVFTTNIVAPAVVYTINGIKYTTCKNSWGGLNIPDIAQNVTVMYSKDKKQIEINTLFQFWLTLGDCIKIFIGGVVIVAGVEIVRARMKK